MRTVQAAYRERTQGEDVALVFEEGMSPHGQHQSRTDGALRRTSLRAYLLDLGLARLALLATLGILAALGSATQVGVTVGMMRAGTTQLPTFIGIWLGTFLALVGVRIVMHRLVSSAAMAIRLDVCRRVIAADLRAVERAGHAKLLSVISEDVVTLAGALIAVPAIGTNILITVATTVYLATVSAKLVLLQLAAMAVGVAITAVPFRSTIRAVAKAERVRFGLVERFRLLVEGTKELKLDQARRRWNSFYVLPEGAARLRDAARIAEQHNAVATGLAQLVAFAVIATTSLVGQVYLHASTEDLATFAVTTFFLMGPIEGVVTRFPIIAAAQAAIERIEGTGLVLVPSEVERQHDGAAPRFDTIEMEDLVFAYGEGDRKFRLGPIDATVRRGQIVFVVGGNGSGKSTFAKLLCGLYRPTEGRVLLNGDAVTNENRDAFRQLFGAVFVDFCLFPEILGNQSSFDEKRAEALLADLGLSQVVSIQDGQFSSTALSTGQRKRLALVSTLLRDPEIFLFDEWAADQDPSFRKVFYRRLLPELRAEGKTVVAITHDEAYFDVADTVIKLEEGHVLTEPTVRFMARLTGSKS